MLGGKFIKLLRSGEIWEKVKLLENESCDFLLVKWPSTLRDLYLIFPLSRKDLWKAIEYNQAWSKSSLGGGYYCYRNISTEGDLDKTILAIKDIWGEELEVEREEVVQKS